MADKVKKMPPKEELAMIWGDPTKRGGLIVILMGLGFLIFSIFVIFDINGNFMQYIIGIAIIGGGIMMLIYGFWKMRRPTFEDPGSRDLGRVFAPGQAVATALADEERPFWFCANCHVIFTTEECHGVCMRCDRSVDLHKVESENDLMMATASVSG